MELDERVERPFFPIQEKCALWLYELTGDIDSFEIDLGSCFVHNVSIGIVGLLSEGRCGAECGECCHDEQRSSHAIHDELLSLVGLFEHSIEVPELPQPAQIMTAEGRTHKAIRVIMPSISKRVEK